jgi:hypothetical protein
VPEILTEMQLEMRRDREAKLLAAGRPLCPVPTRFGGQCLGWVKDGHETCRAHQGRSAHDSKTACPSRDEHR